MFLIVCSSYKKDGLEVKADHRPPLVLTPHLLLLPIQLLHQNSNMEMVCIFPILWNPNYGFFHFKSLQITSSFPFHSFFFNKCFFFHLKFCKDQKHLKNKVKHYSWFSLPHLHAMRKKKKQGRKKRRKT